MIKLFSRNIVRFLVLVLFQVLILNNIQINGYLNPYIYILFIVLLPFETPNWLVLMFSFFMGLTMDIIVNTPGMHTFATIAMGFVRPGILRILAPRDGYEAETFPRVYYYGLGWFIQYALVMVFVHHTILFFIEAFSIRLFFFNISRVILSSIFSATLIVLSQFFVFRR